MPDALGDALSTIAAIGAADALSILLAVPLLYLAVVLFVRASGKRTTGQMNGFDWIVTVALGSLMATGMLPGGASAVEVGLAIALLLALQWIVTWTVRRSKPGPRCWSRRRRGWCCARESSWRTRCAPSG